MNRIAIVANAGSCCIYFAVSSFVRGIIYFSFRFSYLYLFNRIMFFKYLKIIFL